MYKWKAAVYLRLSIEDNQRNESNSISNQKDLINLHLKKEKDLKIYDYYIDDGFTGTDFDHLLQLGQSNAILLTSGFFLSTCNFLVPISLQFSNESHTLYVIVVFKSEPEVTLVLYDVPFV